MKKCKKCTEKKGTLVEKPKSEFYKTKDGVLQSNCITCQKAYHKAYTISNKLQIKKQRQKHYMNNLELYQQRYQKNKEKYKESVKNRRKLQTAC